MKQKTDAVLVCPPEVKTQKQALEWAAGQYAANEVEGYARRRTFGRYIPGTVGYVVKGTQTNGQAWTVSITMAFDARPVPKSPDDPVKKMGRLD